MSASPPWRRPTGFLCTRASRAASAYRLRPLRRRQWNSNPRRHRLGNHQAQQRRRRQKCRLKSEKVILDTGPAQDFAQDYLINPMQDLQILQHNPAVLHFSKSFILLFSCCIFENSILYCRFYIHFLEILWKFFGNGNFLNKIKFSE